MTFAKAISSVRWEEKKNKLTQQDNDDDDDEVGLFNSNQRDWQSITKIVRFELHIHFRKLFISFCFAFHPSDSMYNFSFLLNISYRRDSCFF